MNHLVINGFVCKESGEHYQPGSFYLCNNFERVMELEEKGLIKANEKAASLKVKEEKKESKRTRKKASE